MKSEQLTRFNKFPFQLLAILLLAAGCATTPKTPEPTCDEAKPPFEVDTKSIEQTADISGRLEWCGCNYEPFYLASMQFERLDSCKTQLQLAYLGYIHGDLYKTKSNSLSSRKCEDSDRQKLRDDYKMKLDEICHRANERDGLKQDCDQARKLKI